MSDISVDRHRVLCSLLELNRPLEEILRDLLAVDWDSEVELVMLQPKHVINVLTRLRCGDLKAGEVERWANAIESREDVGIAIENRELLKAAIFDLANPILQGPLTGEMIERLMAMLRSGGG